MAAGGLPTTMITKAVRISVIAACCPRMSRTDTSGGTADMIFAINRLHLFPVRF